jgi:hypothetical protein
MAENGDEESQRLYLCRDEPIVSESAAREQLQPSLWTRHLSRVPIAATAGSRRSSQLP